MLLLQQVLKVPPYRHTPKELLNPFIRFVDRRKEGRKEGKKFITETKRINTSKPEGN
jgi:hypothetical protein